MKKKSTLMAMALLALAAPAVAQWNTNALPRCIWSSAYTDEATGELKSRGDYFCTGLKAARTPDGKTWLSWRNSQRKLVDGNYYSSIRTRLQLLDRDGNPMFSEPLLLNDYVAPTWWSEYSLCVASDGSAIVTVADARGQEQSLVPGESVQGFQPAIYKVSQEGDFLWGLDGVEYPQYVNAPYTYAAVVGDDTYFIFQSINADYTADESDAMVGTFIQRINDDGTTAWDTPLRFTPEMKFLQILPSEGSQFFLFDDCPDGARVHLLDRDLQEVWGEPVVYDNYKYEGYEMNALQLASDGQGGACVAFQRYMGQWSHNIRAQHINADGSLGFGLTGLDCYNADENDHDYCRLAVNPKTQEILVNFESKLEDGFTVMLQKFSFDGDYLFNELGLSIAKKDLSNNYSFGRVGCGALDNGDWMVVYRDVENYSNSSFVIRRYDADGKRLWSKDIGREIDPDNITMIAEQDATYLFYRETRLSKDPGIKIFRIFNKDGKYVDTSDAINDATAGAPSAGQQYFAPDGKRLSQPQKGLTLVRNTDGTAQKFYTR